MKESKQSGQPGLSQGILSLGSSWVQEWVQWWWRQSWVQRVSPLVVVLAYWGSLWALKGLRHDHFSIGAMLLVLLYGGPRVRPFLRFALPFLLTVMIYDSMRFYADFIRGEIHVEFPYLFDKRFFGIQTAEGVLTPNEWWQNHLHPALDLVTGFAYLVFVFQYIAVSGYFRFWWSRGRSASQVTQSSRMPWAFLWLNLLGYSTYYWFAAAPPWYVAQHGLGPALMDVQASSAGCARFDQILGTHFFSEMYGRAADIFGAIPSLHVAYPLLATLYAFQFGALRIFCLLFYALMCFSAVYLNHHYVLDILWGSTYAVFIWIIMGRKKAITV